MPTPTMLHELVSAEGETFYDAFLATEAIPGTTIQAGDFLLKIRYGLKSSHRARIRGEVSRLPRDCFPTLLERLESLELVEERETGGCRSDSASGRLQVYLSDHRARTGSDETSKVLIVRPVRERVSDPIQATSDQAALFELLWQVGGRMPREV